MPDYRYDVFFCYRRDSLTQDWVATVVATLRFWLRQELADDRSDIFWDYDGIDVGDRWPEALRVALRTSKCMVGLWSPTYPVEMVRVGMGEFPRTRTDSESDGSWFDRSRPLSRR
jgi:hypothetical protein